MARRSRTVHPVVSRLVLDRVRPPPVATAFRLNDRVAPPTLSSFVAVFATIAQELHTYHRLTSAPSAATSVSIPAAITSLSLHRMLTFPHPADGQRSSAPYMTSPEVHSMRTHSRPTRRPSPGASRTVPPSGTHRRCRVRARMLSRWLDGERRRRSPA